MSGQSLATLVVCCVLAASCAVDARSTAFECQIQTDCEPDRVCDRGFCVRSGTAGLDGGPGIDADPDGCPGQCTSCAGSVCTIECSISSCDTAPVVCPAGMDCVVACANGGCDMGIDCSMATACTLSCGRDACAGDITCGSGPCELVCQKDACSAGIVCDSSCSCDVGCGPGACGMNATCPTGCVAGRGCTDGAAGCNTCT